MAMGRKARKIGLGTPHSSDVLCTTSTEYQMEMSLITTLGAGVKGAAGFLVMVSVILSP